MKILILLLAVLSFSGIRAQKPLIYKGKIGPYAIEVQFTRCDAINGKFEGKYRYAKKKNFLKLAGQLYAPVLQMDEISGMDTTAQWYLEMEGDSMSGYWAGAKRGYEVKLGYVSGNKNLLTQQSLEDLSKKTNNSLTGTYQVDYHFVNAMWLSEENYTPEIGYNGGIVSIKEIDKTQIEFETEIICGPTYHFASISGIALKQGDVYVFRDGECVITIKIADKKMEIVANQASFACGFGARAYLDHSLIKVSDVFTAVGE